YQVTPEILGRRRATQPPTVRLTARHQAQESARRRTEDLPVEPDATARPDHHLTEIQAQSAERSACSSRSLAVGDWIAARTRSGSPKRAPLATMTLPRSSR